MFEEVLDRLIASEKETVKLRLLLSERDTELKKTTSKPKGQWRLLEVGEMSKDGDQVYRAEEWVECPPTKIEYATYPFRRIIASEN